MLLRNSSTGAFEVYDISNNKITGSASLGTIGLSWNISGFGNFDGAGGLTEMMLRNSSTGAFELYHINGNTLSGSAVAAVGNNFQVVGTGNFSGAVETQMMMQDAAGDLKLIPITPGPPRSPASMSVRSVPI
jgi:hypothetical protein